MATLCFTGRRPKDLFGYNNRADYYPLVNKLAELCEQFITQCHVDTFISGGAQGVDQLAFWAVRRCQKKYPHVRNIVYKPFNGQESRWKQSGVFSQQEYQQMLQCADEVYVVSAEASIPALHKRNEAMVDHSDYVLAVAQWRAGQLSPDPGGTANAFAYAKKHHKPICWLHPETLEVRNIQPS